MKKNHGDTTSESMHQCYTAIFLALIQKSSNQTRNLRLSHPHVLS